MAELESAQAPCNHPLALTWEERNDIRSGCYPNEVHYNDSANVSVDTVLKMLGYVEHLESALEEQLALGGQGVDEEIRLSRSLKTIEAELAETNQAYSGALSEWRQAAGNAARLLRERNQLEQENNKLRANM